MEKRLLGSTGESLSVVGFGGIVVNGVTPEEASRTVGEAVERGINYFDVAPSYGNAEERLGPALKPYRSSAFLACKTGERTRDKAAEQLRESLRRLQTDHFDLYQFHGVMKVEEVDQIMGEGGAMEAFLQARDQGLIRHIGFSAHSEEAALAMMDRFQFDSILFPFSYVIWHQGGFGPRVLARALEKGLGVLALKALAKRRLNEGEDRGWANRWYIPVDSPEEALTAMRWVLSKPITSAVSPGNAKLLWWACDAAEKLTPLSESEAKQVVQATEGIAPVFPLAQA